MVFISKTGLLERALTPDDFEKYKDQVKVFSRENHLIEGCPDNQPDIQNAHGNFKKDLNIVIDAFAVSGINLSLEQIILIDDDLTWMLKDQEKNFLKVRAYDDVDITGGLSTFSKGDKINHLFYAIGLLTTILKSENQLDTLFNLQFKDPVEGSIHKNKYYNYDLYKQKHFYQTGLKVLRTVNKDLQLIDADYIKSVLENHIEPDCRHSVANGPSGP